MRIVFCQFDFLSVNFVLLCLIDYLEYVEQEWYRMEMMRK